MLSVQNDELWCLKMEDWRKEIWPSERSFQHLKLSVTKDMDPRLIHYSEQMQEQSGWKRLSKKTFSKGFLISWSKALEWYTHTHTHTHTTETLMILMESLLKCNMLSYQSNPGPDDSWGWKVCLREKLKTGALNRACLLSLGAPVGTQVH